MMKQINFLRESFKDLITVGALAPTSSYACRALIAPVDFSKAKVIVEFGGGDGVITKHILKAMRPDATLLTFEVNERFCQQLREIDDKRLHVIEDSAEKIGEYLEKHGLGKADAVISSVPFIALPDEIGYKIIGQSEKNLKEGGLHIQIHYALSGKKFYKTIFKNLKINFEPRNFPPAFIHVCTKKVG